MLLLHLLFHYPFITSEIQHWPTPLNLYYRQKRSLLADVIISRWGSSGQSLFSRLRDSTNKHMIRSLSLILAVIAEPTTTKALAAQQKYLGSLAKVISDSKNCFRLFVD